MASVTTSGTGPASALYAELADHILERDQVKTASTLYDLVREGRPRAEILRETIKVHAPYTHVPYHQRVDGGFVRFVNNDHCLLSARTSLRLPDYLPEELQSLPLAQTLWYVPTGLDIWNQLLGRMPGHYSRRTYDPDAHDTVPPPEVQWEDQEPLLLEGSFDERLNEWLSLVQRGEVVRAYRVFLGLFEETAQREKLLGQLVFAGLIDVQDRMLFNRSYTTGHKSYRARATVELGEAIGWDDAHAVLYAGVPDIAVGPRWHSTYEMACQVVLTELEDEAPGSSMDATKSSARDSELFANEQPLSAAESEALLRALLVEPEPAYIEQITALLKSGRGPKRILDVIQIAAARVVLDCGFPDAFSMPQHGYEYTNTLRWFYNRFDHPHRVKLLYVAGSFIRQCAHWVRSTPGNGQPLIQAPKGSETRSSGEILDALGDALITLEKEAAVAWTQAYLEGGYEREPLVRALAMAAVKHGNDPHNQEIGLCMLEDYRHSSNPERETLLLASAQHTAGHRKYGDSLESYRRFAEAFGMDAPERGRGEGEGDPIEALLDDIEAVPVDGAE